MRTGRSRRGAVILLVVVLGLVLAGCAIGGDQATDGGLIGRGVEIPQNALDPAPDSPAVASDDLWNLVLPIAGVVFVLVWGLIGWAVLRFRAKASDDPDAIPKQVAGNTRLEVGWTLIPAVILLVIAVPTVRTIFDLSAQDPDAMHVRVVAKQYWWEFEYLDPEQNGVVTATQLHIPTGRTVQLDMQSVSASVSYNPTSESAGLDSENAQGPVALGVIHSFWVPKLSGKQDVVPGHTRVLSLSTSEPGLYLGQCAEFCGLSHANMRFSVVAEPEEDFDAWIEEQSQPAEVQTTGLAAEGQELFTSQTCVGCHAIAGYPTGGVEGGDVVPVADQSRVGPNLTYFNSRAEFAGGILVNDDDNLREWLRNPQAEKPGAQMPNLNLSDEQIDALVAYLRTLGEPADAPPLITETNEDAPG
jgi:cytochrome c oxidase subunit 2